MMMHCLHVLSTESDFQSRRGAETLANSGSPDLSSDVKTIGRGGTWRSVPFAIRGLRFAGADIVYAWDMPSLLAAALARIPKIVFSPPPLPARRNDGWLRMVMAHRDVTLACDSVTARRGWIGNGVPADRCEVILPGIDPSRIRRRRDPKLRAALGFAETDHVVIAVGESSHAARHDYTVWATSILHVLEPSQKLLLWGRGSACRSAARLAISVGHSELCAIAEAKLGRAVDFEELLPAADMALITAAKPIAPLPIAICMAAGIPIVATPSPIVSEMLRDRENVLMVPCPAPRRIAQAIQDLHANLELQRSLAKRAASDATERYSMAGFIERHKRLYAQVIGGRERYPRGTGVPPVLATR